MEELKHCVKVIRIFNGMYARDLSRKVKAAKRQLAEKADYADQQRSNAGNHHYLAVYRILSKISIIRKTVIAILKISKWRLLMLFAFLSSITPDLTSAI